MYLSDISGAFDRVSTQLLLRKCRAVGVSGKLASFLTGYLAPRQAQVVVDGAASKPMPLTNTVYQGTVLGPPLWNTFFADVTSVATAHGATEAKYADDLNMYKAYAGQTPCDDILADLKHLQSATHSWGRANQVIFDGAKEEFAIIHRRHNHGDAFKLLGIWIDTKLTMDVAVDKVVKKISPKVTALLRTRRFHSQAALIAQYKSHILCHLDRCGGAVFHASDTVLLPLDRVQDRFLRELGLSSADAFLQYNLAPVAMRRDIGILGLIHKCVVGVADITLRELFPAAEQRCHRHDTRLSSRRHNKQVLDRCDGRHSELLARSIFGLVKVYNLLPQHMVDHTEVTAFQHTLTLHAKHVCKSGVHDWHRVFSRC